MRLAPARTRRGFTLLEVLVSLVLLALIMAAIPTALRLSGRAWNTTQELEVSAANDAALTSVEGLVSRAMAIYQRRDNATLRIAFEGHAQAMNFIAASDRGDEGGGLYRLQLAVTENGNNGTGLALRSARISSPVTVVESAAWTSERQLLSDQDTIEFRYFGLTQTDTLSKRDKTWTSEWNNNSQLPELVEVRSSRRKNGIIDTRTRIIELRLR